MSAPLMRAVFAAAALDDLESAALPRASRSRGTCDQRRSAAVAETSGLLRRGGILKVVEQHEEADG